MKKVLLLVVCVAVLAMVPACKKLGCGKAEQMPQEVPAAMPVVPATPELPTPVEPTPEAPK